APEVFFGRAIGRAVVVRQIEMGHATVEPTPQNRTPGFEPIAPPEVLPQAKRDGRQIDAAPAAATVRHDVVITIGGGLVGHDAGFLACESNGVYVTRRQCDAIRCNGPLTTRRRATAMPRCRWRRGNRLDCSTCSVATTGSRSRCS